MAKGRVDLGRWFVVVVMLLGLRDVVDDRQWRAEEADGDSGVDDVDGLDCWIETEPHPSAPSALTPSPQGEGLGRAGVDGKDGGSTGGLEMSGDGR